ncbi:MAG: hypothetical protein ACOCQR_02260 [bacterium]
MKLFSKIKQLFCKHNYKEICSENINDELMRVYGGKKTVKCSKCAKKKYETTQAGLRGEAYKGE